MNPLTKPFKWKPQSLRNSLHNAGVAARNALTQLPGERPAEVVISLSGTYPARTQKRKLFTFPPELGAKDTSLEQLALQLEGLARSPWVTRVVFRFENLTVDPTTAYSLRVLFMKLKAAGKSTTAYMTQVTLSSYYVACAADEIVLPEGAEIFLNGLGIEIVFMHDALERYGIEFDKIAIREYKNAFDNFVRQEMSEAQREQYTDFLASIETTLFETLARDRRRDPDTVRGWFDELVTSASRALELGLIDRIAYEDAVLTHAAKPYADAARFIRTPSRPRNEGGVSVIALEGAIVTGESQRSPFPLPLFGEASAGSETLLRAFRIAEADEATSAIVFYVNSGGGSALASDLIWREVVRIRAKKPVVAVMGSLAASGGYYVLTHADHVIAAPTTLTGSIGVLSVKPVLEGFYRQHGLNVERIRRQPYALMFSPAEHFSPEERAKVEAYIEEVYSRFIARVAEGRRMSVARVDEIGRGHIYSGRDALGLELVDELGDIHTAIDRAKEIAGLHANAPVWNVSTPKTLLLPNAQDPRAFLQSLAPLLSERALLLHPADVRLG